MNQPTAAAEALKRVRARVRGMRPYENIEGSDFYYQQAQIRVEAIIDAELKALEPVDQELEDAKKLIGTWVRSDYMAFKVQEVEREDDDECSPIYIKGNCGFRWLLSEVEPVWVTAPRCCVDDAPKEDGLYLVMFGNDVYLYSFINGKWYSKGDVRYFSDNTKWYELPRGEK